MLVADVARRRPLLSRDVLSPQLARRRSTCRRRASAGCGDALAGPDVVMAGFDLVAARPQLAAAFDHVVLARPAVHAAPVSRRSSPRRRRPGCTPLWGSAEAGFAAQVAAAELDLDGAMRRVWRALSAGSGRFDEALEQELLQGDPFLRSSGAAAAALRALRDAGLLHVDGGGGYHLERPQSKVDVTQTDTYRAWHTLFQTSDFLRTCLTATL